MADADLVINTRLDTSGINIGVKGATKELNNLTGALDQQLKSIKSQEKALRDMNEQLKGLSQAKASPELLEMEKQQSILIGQIDRQKNSYNDLILKRKELLATHKQQVSEGEEWDKLDTAREIDKIESRLLSKKEKILELDRRSADISSQISDKKLIDSELVATAEVLKNKIASTTDELKKSKSVADELRSKLKEVGSAITPTPTTAPIKEPSITEPIKKAKSEAAELKDMIEDALKPEATTAVAEPIKKAKTEIAELNKEINKSSTKDIVNTKNIVPDIENITNSTKKMSKEFQESGRSSENISKSTKSASKEIDGLVGKIRGLNTLLVKTASLIGIAFGVRALIDFGRSGLQATSELQSAMVGLQSIMEGQGRSFQNAQNFINEYTSDGLIPATNAITAFKNLASRGYTDVQIEQTLIALKDAAAFGRQAGLSLGDAVQTATEGLRQENSVLVKFAPLTVTLAA